ncbi:hypothetical protein BZJ19_10965 [Salinivibrio proteolyticus]|nr:hypothetical protein BZG83_14335 [Salinivibrio sp. PR919]OOF17018.1 hypothetical protein BZG84_08840 [Salinivibrio sp. PR932]OOF24752.1 hypothetical protein BZJ19_10965 [Salinivibrio proteolyticus]OOF29970.1 hypothetical protein BZJ20_12995 [Salinivibrio proteolyticus]
MHHPHGARGKRQEGDATKVVRMERVSTRSVMHEDSAVVVMMTRTQEATVRQVATTATGR